MLAFLATIAVIVHAWAAVRCVTLKPMWWPFWAPYCGFQAAMYGLMVWSYLGMDAGTRTAEAHMMLVSVIGKPLLLHPSVLIVVGVLQGMRQVRDVREQLMSGD